eukprot:83143-Amorphochlora_amoeboformis.AAC.1
MVQMSKLIVRGCTLQYLTLGIPPRRCFGGGKEFGLEDRRGSAIPWILYWREIAPGATTQGLRKREAIAWWASWKLARAVSAHYRGLLPAGTCVKAEDQPASLY